LPIFDPRKGNILRKDRPFSDDQAVTGLRLMEDVIFAQRIACRRREAGQRAIEGI
jgi:hypothetical protein